MARHRLGVAAMMVAGITAARVSEGPAPALVAEDAATIDLAQRALAEEVRDKGWIVFSAPTGKGDWDLVLLRPDGSSRRKITDTPELSEAGARFSPDGKKLLYYRMPVAEAVDNNTYGTHELVVAGVDGSAPEVLGKDYPWASWGPDGTCISCLSKGGVQVVDLASRRVVRQLARKGIVQQLVGSPDGGWFAGTANGLGPYWNIGRLNAASGDLNAVSETERYNCTPDWTPDSKSILYSRGIIPEAGGRAAARVLERACRRLPRRVRRPRPAAQPQLDGHGQRGQEEDAGERAPPGEA